ncbi:transporter substrate-binding domain-containing protein [Cereibacter changlensis]|uniref:Transporter substrate-binding domain-containing protein n=1 Tax=Cereibacter changlensis TaxID=402884 RepID=A0A4V5NL98_9RHOB|nr:transporter substrate-binding domain-containing protein [Cereibacter changlensis]TKA94877.1 transporter substrate-binding domain-containing protein [Cereibacter changlensis]
MLSKFRSGVSALALPALVAGAALVTPAAAQETSRLIEVTKSGTLRVCQYPMYYSISFRNPTTGEIEGIDADLSKELAKELGVELEIVESSFGTFIADIQASKCDIGMFGIGATLQRAQAVEFSKPYLRTSIYGIARKDGKVATWGDIDKPGIRAVTTLGSYVEPFMRDYLKQATLEAISPPATREGELMTNRADVVMSDYPTAIKVQSEFDWAVIIKPDEPLRVTPYSYVVPQGDQIWLNYVNLFVDTIKLDGRLDFYAEKNGLTEIVAD